MKLLVYSDLQATTGHERCFHDPTVPLQQYRVMKFLSWLRRVYDEHQCDGLVDLGDTTDDRSAIPISTINTVLGELKRFDLGSQYNLKLIGNHEQYFRSPNIHTGLMYQTIFNTIETVSTVDLGHAVIVAASFMNDLHGQAELIRGAINGSRGIPIIFFGHLTVNGSRVHGEELTDGHDISIIDDIAIGLMGHVHSHQAIGDRAFYVGSPFQQDFGEMGHQKYVVILDTKKAGLGKDCLTWINVEGFPIYHRVKLDDFISRVDGNSEDRFEVYLSSLDESTRFFSHPLATRAIPVYTYGVQSSNPAEVLTETSQSSYDPRTLIREYVGVHHPSQFGLDVEEDEMVYYGTELFESSKND